MNPKYTVHNEQSYDGSNPTQDEHNNNKGLGLMQRRITGYGVNNDRRRRRLGILDDAQLEAEGQ